MPPSCLLVELCLADLVKIKVDSKILLTYQPALSRYPPTTYPSDLDQTDSTCIHPQANQFDIPALIEESV